MSTQNTSQILMAPLSGKLYSIEVSADPVFAQRMVGDGVMIEPTDNTLVAPLTGTVSQLHHAGHAVAVKTDTGFEVLMHIGIDTVTLKGQGFESLVTLGQQVIVGQPLIRFDATIIGQHGLSTQTVVLLTSGESVATQAYPREIVAAKDQLFTVADTELEKPAATTPLDSAHVSTATGDVVIKNHLGLHARPAAFLVRVAKAFQSSITLTKKIDGQQCLASSVTSIMGMQLKLAQEVSITATGTDAAAAVQAIIDAVNSGLGEAVTEHAISDDDIEFPIESPLLTTEAQVKDQLTGVKAAPGMAVGSLQFRTKQLPSYPETGASVEEENQQLEYAIKQAHAALTQLIESLTQSDLSTQSEVFSAQLQILADPAIAEQCKTTIAQGKSAMAAWHQAYKQQANSLKRLDDPLLRARGSDIEDVGFRVMQCLLGIEESEASYSDDTLLVMDDITPSEVITLGRSKIKGLLTVQGGSTSHAAILASSVGLPYLVNVSETIFDYSPGTKALLNASAGRLQLNPTDDSIAEFLLQQRNKQARFIEAQHLAHQPAITIDGCEIEVAANVASVADAEYAASQGADAIGLVRSEFLYFNRLSEPSLQEQTDTYRGILQGIGSHKPCIIRTLDVGGDKPLPYLALPGEENPFLGERGIRVSLNRPHMLRKQIRAILLAASSGRPRIMFPMIASIEEFRAAKAMVSQEQERIGLSHIDVGVMIEVPSAALMADVLAQEADFFSIGTNDLTQYTLAMDRGHPKLAAQVDALHPAVLRLIYQTAQASIAAGKWTGICGGIASDPLAVAVLIGLGVTELSASIPQLALVKAKVRSLNLQDCQQLAKEAMSKSTAAEVRELLKQHDNS